MPRKRKDGYLEKIMEIKKRRSEDVENEDVGGGSGGVDGGGGDAGGVGFEFKTKSASEMLEKILKEASPDDIVGEFLWFLKSVPKLLNNQISDLVHLVKTELDVGKKEKKLCGKFNFSGDSYPILDALSCKIGINLRTIIAPPTTKCILCKKELTPNHKPIQVPLHTMNGPQLATKYAWECRSCRCVGDFGEPGQVDCSKNRIYYQVDMFGNWVFLNQTIWVLKCKKCEANMAPCL